MKICVVGGGAAGMLAAVLTAQGGADVVLLEKNEKLGKKLYITGKGRCNLTNDCEVRDFLGNVVRGGKFLQSALYGFSPKDTMDFFEAAGLPLVTERGNRVFPLSQKSSDVIKTLQKMLEKAGVKVMLNTAALAILRKGACFEIRTADKILECDKVFIATGGKSYPLTGSTGDGYDFAKYFGHAVTEPKQALAPLILKEDVSSLQGISLKNVTLSAYGDNGKLLKSEFGEMLFTNKGISGPIVLSVSSFVNRSTGVKLALDLKPALDERKLDDRILRDFLQRSNQDVKNVTRALLPDRLNGYVLAAAKIPEWKKANSVTKEERARFCENIKKLTFTLDRLAPFEEAVITSGGVDLKQLKPSMESRLENNLYFIGEVADVDALTGGFNLQIAFSTAAAAARDALRGLGASDAAECLT